VFAGVALVDTLSGGRSISFCRGAGVSPRPTFTLKLGDLELQLTPAVWTYLDLKRTAEAFADTQQNANGDPLQAMQAAINTIGVLIDLVLKAAKPHHPDLTRAQLEDLGLDALMELPARLGEAQNGCLLPSRRIH
jgi:hypothetical protein